MIDETKASGRPLYIGDGVYVTFDGWHVWLRTERENGTHEIALGPDELKALDAFVARMRGESRP